MVKIICNMDLEEVVVKVLHDMDMVLGEEEEEEEEMDTKQCKRVCPFKQRLFTTALVKTKDSQMRYYSAQRKRYLCKEPCLARLLALNTIRKKLIKDQSCTTNYVSECSSSMSKCISL